MKTSFIMLFVWLLLFCSSQTTKAQNETIELTMKQNRDAWVCGDNDRDKKFIISVSIGEIKYQDSLYAIQVWLKYNPDKLLFVNLLDKNTLAEFFEIKGFNVFEPGELNGYAMTMGQNQAVGNKPLLAFEVKYLGDCPDTAHINLDDIELDISKSFLNRLNYKDKNLIVDIKTMETENSFVNVGFLQDTLKEFNADSTADILIDLNTNNLQRIDSLDFEIKYKKHDNYELTDIDLFDAGLTKMSIDSIIRKEEGDTNKITVKSHLLSVIENENVMKLKCRQIRKENDTVRLDIKISRINDCSCATSFKGDKVFILSKEDTTTPIVEDDNENEDINIDCYYDFIADDFVVKSRQINLRNVILFDIMGRLIEYKSDIKMPEEFRIESEIYVEGIYIMQIKLLNGIEINKVLIKN